MRLTSHTVVTAELEINDQEAEVLFHLTSYDLIEWFNQKCNGIEFPLSQVKDTLGSLHRKCSQIITAKRAAQQAVMGAKL